MTDWTYKYRQEQIPGANPAGVINAHRPGRQIADAITELQERAITDATLDAQGGLTGSVEVEDGTLILSLRSDDVAPPPEPADVLPSGGEPGMVLTRTSDGYVWDWVRAVEI